MRRSIGMNCAYIGFFCRLGRLLLFHFVGLLDLDLPLLNHRLLITHILNS